MTLDTAVIGGNVVSEVGIHEVDLGVADGRIVGIEPRGAPLDAATTIDASGRYVVPGGIDTHTHIQWPWADRARTDTWELGSRLAALGGTTTVIDFVPARLGESPRRWAAARVEEADGRSVVDFAFHPILVSASSTVLRDVRGLVDDGFASFKMFTTYEGLRNDDRDVWLLTRAIAEAGGLPGFHAENDDICRGALAEMVASGRTSVRDYPASRPQVAEAESIGMVATFARTLGTPAWIFHVSGADGIAALDHARRAGTSIRAETCTHYLAFDDAVYAGADPWRYVIAPPIRGVADRAALWRAVADGGLASVGSDHGGYVRDQKQAGIDADDFTLLPQGGTGVEARLPLLWSMGVAQGRMTPSQFVTVGSGSPARTMGLWPTKGSLRPGSDADLVLIDPDAEWTFPPPDPTQGPDFSLYEGMPFRGRPVLTMVRGKVVARDGQVVGRTTHGRFLQRHLVRSAWTLDPDAASIATPMALATQETHR